MAALANQSGNIVDLGTGRAALAVVMVGAAAPVLANQSGNVVDQGSGRLATAVVLVDGSGNPLTPGSGAVVAKTANYTATSADEIILVSALAGAVTISLPAAASSAGQRYTIKKTDVGINTVIINPNGSELVDGALTLSITAQYEAYTVFCDGSAWWIV